MHLLTREQVASAGEIFVDVPAHGCVLGDVANYVEPLQCVAWKAAGGYGGQSKQHNNPNARRERIWFSPHCLRPDVAPTLFDLMEVTA